MPKRMPMIRDNTDEEERAIQKGIRSDPDAPEILPSQKVARVGRPVGQSKKQVTVRLDKDLLEILRAPEPKGWQTRLNQALRDALTRTT
ncbi:MAG: BrnA antitoxin family protein [Minwuia sp.]|nr:BrnA antitoxin family protein [Minwuia sp.]